jgi:uncharacterized membrane protein
MKGLLNILLSLLVIIYPVSVYFGLSYLQPKIIGLGLVGLMLLRFFAQGKQLLQISAQLMPILIVGTLVGLSVYFSNSSFMLKLYPSLISLSLLIVFGYSLWQPQTMIERIARITEPDLSAAGVHYTRQVTYVWCVFFVVNGSIALYTSLFSSLEVWTFYNGLLSYLLIGALFAIEYSVRMMLRRRGNI